MFHKKPAKLLILNIGKNIDKMNYSKEYSNKKIAWFNEKMKSFVNGNISAPIYVRIKPINKCCHKCFFCVYNPDMSNMHENINKCDKLKTSKLFEILDDFKEIGVKAVTYSGGGEPLMHDGIVEVFNKTIENKIDLSLITNGQLLTGNISKALTHAKWIRISADYYDSDTFVKSRGTTNKMFNKIIENMQEFSLHENRKCDISINYIITNYNFDNIQKAVLLFKSANVGNIRFSPVWVPNFFEYHKKIEKRVLQQLEYCKKNFMTNSFKIYDSYNIVKDILYRSYDKCYIMQTIPVIGADGNIYACHNKSYSNDAIIGNILNNRFKNIWFSKEAYEIFNSFNPIKSCKCQCANDSKNKFIYELINCHGDNYV